MKRRRPPEEKGARSVSESEIPKKNQPHLLEQVRIRKDDRMTTYENVLISIIPLISTNDSTDDTPNARSPQTTKRSKLINEDDGGNDGDGEDGGNEDEDEEEDDDDEGRKAAAVSMDASWPDQVC